VTGAVNLKLPALSLGFTQWADVWHSRAKRQSARCFTHKN